MTTVRVGEFDISSDKDCQVQAGEYQCAPSVQDILIEKMIVHPNYDVNNKTNDIGLLRLGKEIKFNQQSVTPICLPLTPDLMRIILPQYIVTGWGHEFMKGNKDGKLLRAKLFYVEPKKCVESLANDVAYEVRVPENICLVAENITDACVGDGGGVLQFPINIANRGAKYVQFGLLSFGYLTCEQTKYPDVYTHLPYYIEWILDTIEP